GPAELARARVRTIHECERWRHDDSRAVVLAWLASRKRGEIGQLGERHVHAEGRGFRAIARERAAPLAGNVAERTEQPLRMRVRDDAARLDDARVRERQ